MQEVPAEENNENLQNNELLGKKRDYDKRIYTSFITYRDEDNVDKYLQNVKRRR